MNMKQKLKFWAARFGRNEDGGTVAIEFVMMVPLLAWAFLSTITYFHAYRTEAIAHKAGLTIADMISREADYITPQYLSGARSLLRFLTLDDKYPDIRITVAYWDAGENKYKRAWSKERGPRSPLTRALWTVSAGTRHLTKALIPNSANRKLVMNSGAPSGALFILRCAARCFRLQTWRVLQASPPRCQPACQSATTSPVPNRVAVLISSPK